MIYKNKHECAVNKHGKEVILIAAKRLRTVNLGLSMYSKIIAATSVLSVLKKERGMNFCG